MIWPTILNEAGQREHVMPVRSVGADGTDGGVAGTPSITAVASQATSVSLLAANPSRKGVILVNTDANDLYLKYGTTASTVSLTVIIPSGATWEMPSPIYTGAIDGIWAADGAGSAQITEV